MDADFKTKWVAALRSGEFTQCRGRLYDGSGYCCLGVAEKVLNPAAHLHTRKEAPLSTELLGEVSIEAKIRLIELNDDWKKSFQQIADYIEQSL